MTANELADLLDFDAKTLNWKAFADAATMLRQQQAEIESLKADTIPYRDLHQVVKNVLAQPMRELTDEEILKVLTEDYHGLTIVNFARAILKKASEK